MAHTRAYKSFLETAQVGKDLELVPTEFVTLGNSYRYILRLVQRGKVRVVDLLCDAESLADLAKLRKEHFKGWLLDDLKSCEVLF